MNKVDSAQVFKALGDPTRLAIVNLLVGRELCVCDILDAFALSQPAVSHHLKILKQAGVLLDHREGKWIYYRLNLEVIQEALLLIQKLAVLEEPITRIEPCSPHRL